MKKLLLLAALLPTTIFAQISYTVTVTKLKAKADDCDGGAITFCSQAPQDPVYNIWTGDAEANEFTNCWIFDGDPEAEYNLWKDIQNLEIASVSSVNTSWISFDMAGFESDALGSPGCSSGVGDDAVHERQFVLQLDLSTVPEDTDHTITMDLNDVYFAEVVIHWIDLTAGISPLTQNIDFSLVPNPTNGVFKVNLESQGIDQFNVFVTDLAGRTIFQQDGLSHQSEIDLSTNESGAYFVTVEVDGTLHTERILLN
jgi:hypothetical protein